jgi:hypothetical protein
LIACLSVAAYVFSRTDVDGPLDQARHKGQALNSPPSGTLDRAEVPSSSFIEPTVVTIVDHPVERSVAVDQSLAPRGRDAIGRELQKELKRVGCYAGELNGVWTTSTRQAMNAFTDRVNAKLPIDKPDSILLALVRGYSNRVCGAPCPSDQSLSRTLQCTPNALLARSNGTKLTTSPEQGLAQATSAWSVKTTVAGGVPVQLAGTEHPGDAASLVPPASSGGPPPQEYVPYRATRNRGQRVPRHEGGWGSNFFRQLANGLAF